jgi:hypothetical protein
MCDNILVGIGYIYIHQYSLSVNYELDVLIEDPELAHSMEDQFRHDMARSREVASRPVRGPRRVSQALPEALTHQQAEAPTVYRRSRREARRRAVLLFRAVASNARRSVFGPISAIFIVLGLLLVVIPRTSAYVLAALCAWFALGAAREAFRRRADR